MRNQFLGHFKETDETVAELWKKATFVFDANVLLNLYRYSDDTRDDFLKLLKSLKSRSWLPEQAAHEFLKNRATVIKDQIGSYDTTQSDIDKLSKSFSGSRAHPFISKDTKDSFESAVKMINAEMAENKQKQEGLIHKDSIKDQVADLFDGRVGERYTSDDLVKIFTQGKDRYAAKVPPGYKDGGKISDPKTESDKRSNFGDWIIWKQIMDYATSAKKSIILVTDDRKEDWWEEEYGKTLGPRPELINEFAKTSEQKILIYTPDSFLHISKIQLKTKISRNSIDEVGAEHSRREEKRQNKQLARNIHQRIKLERVDKEAALLSKQYGNDVLSWHSKDTPQDGLRRMGRNLSMESVDNASYELRAKLLSSLNVAITHKKALRHRAKILDTEYHHSIETEDTEMAHNRHLLQLSIDEELGGISDYISNLRAEISYLREKDDLI